MEKEMKKRVVSAMLATTLFFGGCGINREQVNVKQTDIKDIIFNEDNFIVINEDNKYTIYPNSIVYLKNGSEEIIGNYQIVNVIGINNKYAKIELGDGTIGFVRKESLIKCPNLNRYNYEVLTDYKDKIVTELSYLYNSEGMYIGNVDVDVKCKAVATNGEYTLIILKDGKSAFISSNVLMNEIIQINGYGIVNNDGIFYLDKELTILDNNINAGQLVRVLFINGDCACISINDNNEVRYINVLDLNKNFIVVDLDLQRMDCYLDYKLSGSWGTRTGKNITPTHSGLFDIDDKFKDFEFTSFPGCYAKYWMPINEYEEGIHDLVGDDEANYGNYAYQLDGSHGCIRVPREGSKFVYDNYQEGDLVLVRKK